MTRRDPRLLAALFASVASFFLLRHAFHVSFLTYLDRQSNEQPCTYFGLCSHLQAPSTEELLLHGGSFLLLLTTVSMLAWAWVRPMK